MFIPSRKALDASLQCITCGESTERWHGAQRCKGEEDIRRHEEIQARTGRGLWARPRTKLMAESRRSCWTKLSKRNLRTESRSRAVRSIFRGTRIRVGGGVKVTYCGDKARLLPYLWPQAAADGKHSAGILSCYAGSPSYRVAHYEPPLHFGSFSRLATAVDSGIRGRGRGAAGMSKCARYVGSDAPVWVFKNHTMCSRERRERLGRVCLSSKGRPLVICPGGPWPTTS